MQYKKYWLIAILLTSTIVLFKILSAPKTIEKAISTDKINITTSFYPLAYLAEKISGERGLVTNITPAGTEPHDFEPTPRDMAKIYQSALFIFNGGGIDSWAEKFQNNVKVKPTNILTLNMSNELTNTDKSDPHFWLDPNFMSQQGDIILASLIKIDSKHTEEYTNNWKSLKNDLAELDQEYQTGLSNCQLREIVTSHDAFGYLAKRYNFSVFHILGISPEDDPSPKKIAEIANLARDKNIKYIFFETMVSSKLSQTIASEIGASTLVLDPIEGLLEQDSKNNEDYLSLMKKNLTNLKTAMVCQ